MVKDERLPCDTVFQPVLAASRKEESEIWNYSMHYVFTHRLKTRVTRAALVALLALSFFSTNARAADPPAPTEDDYYKIIKLPTAQWKNGTPYRGAR